jgi:hypothetical protein
VEDIPEGDPAAVVDEPNNSMLPGASPLGGRVAEESGW